MHNFNEFINYVLDFYGQNGIYDQGRTKEQIAFATTMYLDAIAHYANDDDKRFRHYTWGNGCLLYTSPSPRDLRASRMPSSA